MSERQVLVLRRRPRVLFGFAIVLACSFAIAQNSSSTPTTQHPNIGLVFEGGGALGLAHIGVIEWLEEHRIPVEYGQNELLTNQYYLFQTGYLRKVLKLPVLLGEGVYFNGLFEVGKVFAPLFKSQVPGDISAAMVINTIFGPLSVGGAVGTVGHQRVFFKLGRIF